MRFEEISTIVKNNADTLGWHIVFLFVIPNFLNNSNLENYANILSSIALTYAASSKKDGLFKNLYCEKYKNIISYSSTTLIDVLTLSGIAATAIKYDDYTNDTHTATFVAAVTFLLLFILPKRIIPKAVNYSQNLFNETSVTRNASGIVTGFLVIMALLTIKCIVINSLA